MLVKFILYWITYNFGWFYIFITVKIIINFVLSNNYYGHEIRKKRKILEITLFNNFHCCSGLENKNLSNVKKEVYKEWASTSVFIFKLSLNFINASLICRYKNNDFGIRYTERTSEVRYLYDIQHFLETHIYYFLL